MFRLRWLSCRRREKLLFQNFQAHFSPFVRRVAATCPKVEATPLLSPDVSLSYWTSLCVPDGSLSIALNAMGINIKRLPPYSHFLLHFQNLNTIFFSKYSTKFLLFSSLSITADPKSTTTRKRKYKPKNPPGPDQEVISWREDELTNLVQNFGLSSD
ncbi:hypothetical protein Hanom_Chr01g00023961 [Helianthus anomalus]